MTRRKGHQHLALLFTCLVALGCGANQTPAAAQSSDHTGAPANGGNVNSAGPRVARQGVSQAATRRLGPAWRKGQDNAQNPNRVKQGMKQQEWRQRHQYKQAMTQVQEQQQQQYEKEMLQKLGSQRPEIQKNRQEIKQVRRQTGAND